MRHLVAALLLVMTVPLAAQEYERILLPIAFIGQVPGGFGTRWDSENLLFNDGQEPISYLLACEGCSAPETLGPRAFRNLEPIAHESTAAFVWVTRGARFQFTSLLHDVSRVDENVGTEIPVARESDYKERIVLPRVPLRGPFRTTLRIYGDTEMPSEVRVRMYRLDRALPFVDVTLQLNGIVNIQNEPYPPFPAYYHLFDLVSRYPVLEAAASVRVEIDSLTNGAKVWAFASMTNNATQLVTTVSPQ